MEVVIEAEKRSIGTLQHAMYAQAAWGDSLVVKRRLSQRTHAERLQDIEDAQKATKHLSHDEKVLATRVEAQKDEIQAKLRRLQEVEDMTRILSLQIEEVKSAVTTGKRDLVRAQTLDAECGQVARIASNRIDDIVARKNRPGSAALLSHTRDSMFGGGATSSTSETQQQRQNLQSYPPQHGAQIGDGTHRYKSNITTTTNRTPESPIVFSAVTTTNQPQQQQQLPARKLSSSAIPNHHNHQFGGSSTQNPNQQQQRLSPTNDEIRFTASGAPSAWQTTTTTASAQQPQNLAQAYQDARADTNEWLRRYVGSMRGLHLTALAPSSASAAIV